MKEYLGKKIPTTLEELIKPETTALMVIDMQNDYCSEKGALAKKGIVLYNYEKILKNSKALIEAARKAGVMRVYTRNTMSPDGKRESPASIRLLMNAFKVDDPNFLPRYIITGTWGHDVIDELKPKEGGVIVDKYRHSSFTNTDLDLLLRSNNIRTLVVTGVTTEGCVISTVRDGSFHDYFVVIAKDCISSFRKDRHELVLKIMETYFDMADSDEIIRTWSH